MHGCWQYIGILNYVTLQWSIYDGVPTSCLGVICAVVYPLYWIDRDHWAMHCSTYNV